MKSSSKLKSSLLGLALAVSPLAIQSTFSASPNPLFQNSLWWFGTPNPTPPPSTLIRTFEPLASLPGFSQPFFGWYQNLNFEACVLGISSSVAGPYGTSTTSMTGCDGVANSPAPQQPTGNADAAVDAGTGGMSTAAAVTTVVVVAGAVAIAVSGGGGGSTGTTGTTGSR